MRKGRFSKYLEEAQFIGAIAYQQVLGLLVVVQHHLMVFTTDARLLVAAKCSVGWIGVIVVHPHAACLDSATKAVTGVHVTRPDASAEAIHRVIRDFQSFGFILERGDRNNGPKDFLLENPHLVMPLEDRRLDVVPARQFTVEPR